MEAGICPVLAELTSCPASSVNCRGTTQRIQTHFPQLLRTPFVTFYTPKCSSGSRDSIRVEFNVGDTSRGAFGLDSLL